MTDPEIERLDALALDGLRYYANRMQEHTQSVERYAKLVAFKRPFETMAEDELEKAEAILETALVAVRRAREEYAAKQPTTFMMAAE